MSFCNPYSSSIYEELSFGHVVVGQGSLTWEDGTKKTNTYVGASSVLGYGNYDKFNNLC